MGAPAWLARIGAASVAVVAWSAMALPAHAVYAEDPLSSLDSDKVTDKVGALGDREDEIIQAIDGLFNDHSLDLYVAYVDSFSGRTAQDWADETAQRNGLGTSDALLAVATGDRQYAWSVDQNYPLSDQQLADVERVAIEPALRQNDWAGAAIGAANGVAAVRAGQQVQPPEITPGEANPSSGSSATPWVVGGLVVAGIGVAGWAVARSYRKRGGESIPVDQLPTEELEKRAGVLLVETDDAIKTNEQEVGFAHAQYGEEAAKPFAEAVAEANEHLDASFKLRQKLDDSSPEDEGTRRKMLTEIVERLDAANARLDEEGAAFDKLRDLEQNAPEVLATVNQNGAKVTERLAQSRTTLQS